jgi:hypothetical protein
VANNGPTLVGEKSILTEQFAFGASVAVQVFVCEKLEAFVPMIEMELMARTWSPLLTIENTWVGPLAPTVTLPKFAVDGKIAAAGPLRA